MNIAMQLDVCEQIQFKLGMMLDTIEGYILILALVTLPLIQGHRGVRKPELCQSSLRIQLLCHLPGPE